jgi:hypothetical protein
MSPYNRLRVEPTEFDELAFFRSIQRSGARAVLIGRRALVLLGLPVLTTDYDFWIAIDGIAAFNAACLPFGLTPTLAPEEARRTGRYVLENDEHVDVLVARSLPTLGGEALEFERVWEGRQSLELEAGVGVFVPGLDDLIRTKQVSSRPKDLEDIRLLRALRSDRRP